MGTRAALVLAFHASIGAAALAAEAPMVPTPGAGFVPAKLVKQVPVRPPKFGIVGFSGVTMLACFIITTEGKAKEIVFPNIRDNDPLEIPIRRALVRWRWEPATQDGVAVEQPGCVQVDVKAIGG